jgi:hypothetical protein
MLREWIAEGVHEQDGEEDISSYEHENCVVRSVMIYTPHQISIRMRCVQPMAHISRREMYERLGCKTTRTVTHRRPRHRRKHNSKMNVKEMG